MKKIQLSLLILLIFTFSIFILSSCDTFEDIEEDIAASLYSDNGYINYAEEVFFDTVTYPDLEEMGMFWAKWDEDTETIIQVPADSEEGAALIDPNKPTIINVHGVLLDGYLQQERFFLNGKIANPSEFNLETSNVSMLHLWIREGWNVGTFHYNRFASENNPANIESKIWATDGPNGVRYRKPDGSYSEGNITNYTLAEHFAAEYIRAMNLLPATMGSQEIRVAAHSMGGQISTAAIFLLTELVKAGQMDESKLPNRYALLDAYFSTTMGDFGFYMGPKDITIRWSGKPIIENNTGVTMLYCLKAMEEQGIVLEYYTYEESFLRIGMSNVAEEFKTLTTYTIVYPNYKGKGYTVLTDGHNGVREWYLCSLLNDMVKDITNGVDSDEYAPSAAMSTEMIKNLKGREYIMVDGSTTVNAGDDTMTSMYSVYYVLNGGINPAGNKDYYTSLTASVNLRNPTKKDAVFLGWYDNPAFSGDPITAIDTSIKAKLRLYAKWDSSIIDG